MINYIRKFVSLIIILFDDSEKKCFFLFLILIYMIETSVNFPNGSVGHNRRKQNYTAFAFFAVLIRKNVGKPCAFITFWAECSVRKIKLDATARAVYFILPLPHQTDVYDLNFSKHISDWEYESN